MALYVPLVNNADFCLSAASKSMTQALLDVMAYLSSVDNEERFLLSL
jgi:hypothetical protein